MNKLYLVWWPGSLTQSPKLIALTEFEVQAKEAAEKFAAESGMKCQFTEIVTGKITSIGGTDGKE